MEGHAFDEASRPLGPSRSVENQPGVGLASPLRVSRKAAWSASVRSHFVLTLEGTDSTSGRRERPLSVRSMRTRRSSAVSRVRLFSQT